MLLILLSSGGVLSPNASITGNVVFTDDTTISLLNRSTSECKIAGGCQGGDVGEVVEEEAGGDGEGEGEDGDVEDCCLRCRTFEAADAFDGDDGAAVFSSTRCNISTFANSMLTLICFGRKRNAN